MNYVHLNGKLNRPESSKVVGWDGRRKHKVSNALGSHLNALVRDSPFYIGYRSGGHVYRYGINHRCVQDAFQNTIHRYFPPGRTDYFNLYAPGYEGGYFSSSPYNPFSIYYY